MLNQKSVGHGARVVQEIVAAGHRYERLSPIDAERGIAEAAATEAIPDPLEAGQKYGDRLRNSYNLAGRSGLDDGPDERIFIRFRKATLRALLRDAQRKA